jgi:hypothetical protein
MPAAANTSGGSPDAAENAGAEARGLLKDGSVFKESLGTDVPPAESGILDVSGN